MYGKFNYLKFLFTQLLLTGGVIALFMNVGELKDYTRMNSWIHWTAFSITMVRIIILKSDAYLSSSQILRFDFISNASIFDHCNQFLGDDHSDGMFY